MKKFAHYLPKNLTKIKRDLRKIVQMKKTFEKTFVSTVCRPPVSKYHLKLDFFRYIFQEDSAWLLPKYFIGV